MAEVEKPLVELFVKAAPSDRDDKGACPISQQWFMAFYILVDKNLINLRVTPVNMDQPPSNYTKLEVGKRLPVVWVESGSDPTGRDITGLVADGSDELEKLMDLWKCPNLALSKDNPDVGDVEKVFADLYKDTNNLLKNNISKPLINDIKRLDGFLEHGGTRYLMGEDLTYPDCQLMPKLQHLRVAGQFYKDFEIPHEFRSVWNYIESMYATTAFQYSCPVDRDIIMHYQDKISMPAGRMKPSLMEATRLTTVPSSVLSGRYPVGDSTNGLH